MAVNVDDQDFIPGIDNNPNLQFEVGTPAYRRFMILRKKQQAKNTIISWEWLERVGALERAMEIIGGETTPWGVMFCMGWHARREVTLEVYSTFVFRPRDPDAPELVESEIAAGRADAEVTFQIFGEMQRMSLRRFAVVSGLYSEEETRDPIYTTAIRSFADDADAAWWPAIGDGPFVDRRTTDIRDPLYRYLHRLIATSIAGRHFGTDRVTAIDLFYLRCLLTHTPCHLAHCLADYISGYYHRQRRGQLIGGTLVAQLAHGLGYAMQMEQLALPSLAPRLAAEATALGMRIAKEIPGVGYRLVRNYETEVEWVPEPLVDPVQLAAAQVHIEQVEELADGEVQPVQPPQADPPPPQHVPRVIRAVRLPAPIVRQIEHIDSRVTAIEAELTRMRDEQRRQGDVLQWMVDHMRADYASRGVLSTDPPPRHLTRPDGAGGAGEGTSAAGGAGAGTSAAGGAGAGTPAAATYDASGSAPIGSGQGLDIEMDDVDSDDDDDDDDDRAEG